jgi:tetratricopeptide (TPR) repeat protein
MPQGERRSRRGRRAAAPRTVHLSAAAALFVLSLAAGAGTGAAFRVLRGAPPAPDGPPAREAAGAASPHQRLMAAEQRFQRGVELLGAERLSEALVELAAAAELDPTDPRPHHGLGKIHGKLFLTEKAEAAYRRALALDPAFRPSKESLAMLLHEKGRYDEAVNLLRELERETPDEPFVWAELAINAAALGDHQEAIALLEKYNAARGQQAWGLAHLGRAYAAVGRAEEAETAYRQALAADRHFQLAYYWLGQLLVTLGREKESEPLLAAYRRMRQWSTEEQQLKMALLGEQAGPGTLVALARVQSLLGKRSEALATLERARRLAPGDAQLEELQQKLLREGEHKP